MGRNDLVPEMGSQGLLFPLFKKNIFDIGIFSAVSQGKQNATGVGTQHSKVGLYGNRLNY